MQISVISVVVVDNYWTGGLDGESSSYANHGGSIHRRMPDQSHRFTFVVQNDPATEYIPKIEKIWGFSFKFLELEVSQCCEL